MRRIFPEDYVSLPRHQLRSGKASLRDGRGDDLKGFCQRNFGTADASGLANLYELLYANGSHLRLPLKAFAEIIGQPKKGVLRGAPRHSTVSISTWGLRTEYPEMHLVRDLATAFNSATNLGEQIHEFEGIPVSKAKEIPTRSQIAGLQTHASYNRRMCVLACFNLIEAYVNGVAWDYVESHDISGLSRNRQDLLASGQASILDKIVKIPEIVTGKTPGPLAQDQDPLKTFRDTVKPFRDSIVHASPFSAPARFGGYDKLSRIYELTLDTVRTTVTLTIDIIGLIHRFIGQEGQLPEWFPTRASDGRFEIENLF